MVKNSQITVYVVCERPLSFRRSFINYITDMVGKFRSKLPCTICFFQKTNENICLILQILLNSSFFGLRKKNEMTTVFMNNHALAECRVKSSLMLNLSCDSAKISAKKPHLLCFTTFIKLHLAYLGSLNLLSGNRQWMSYGAIQQLRGQDEGEWILRGHLKPTPSATI